MLKKETIEKLAAASKIDVAVLTEAINSAEEKELAIAEVQSFTTDELTTRDTTITAEAKRAGQVIGETVGLEKTVKELKRIMGVEFEGKEIAKLSDAITAKMGTGDAGLREQVTLLQKQVAEKDLAIAAETNKSAEAIFDQQLVTSFPANRRSVDKGGLTDREYLAAVKANLAFEKGESGITVKKDGQIVRDAATTAPTPFDKVVSSYFAERKWNADEVVKPVGRVGVDGKLIPAGKYSKLSEVITAWDAEGKSTVTAEFQAHVNQLKKDDPDFKLGE